MELSTMVRAGPEGDPGDQSSGAGAFAVAGNPGVGRLGIAPAGAGRRGARPLDVAHAGDVSLGIEAARRESAVGPETEHRIGARISARW